MKKIRYKTFSINIKIHHLNAKFISSSVIIKYLYNLLTQSLLSNVKMLCKSDYIFPLELLNID